MQSKSGVRKFLRACQVLWQLPRYSLAVVAAPFSYEYSIAGVSVGQLRRLPLPWIMGK
jgi:hypothetical protein